MCCNHVTAILAANHSQQKCFKSPSVYDTLYDEAVRGFINFQDQAPDGREEGTQCYGYMDQR